MAACNAGQAPVDGGDCEDCVQVVKTTKRVRVPCHRNTFKQYTVKVPRQVTEKVARTVQYTEMENRTKQVPYTVNRQEQRIRMEEQKYQVPVQKTITKMVTVTRKVPKTIYVNVTSQVPKTETVTNMETRTRQVKIPYTVNVPEQKFRTVSYQEPVNKCKTVMDNVTKTVFDTQVRTRCEPKVTYVTKTIPVYNVVARPAQPCPPDADCGQNNGGGGNDQYRSEFEALDTNNDGVLSQEEYAAARAGAGGQGGHAAGGHGAQGQY